MSVIVDDEDLAVEQMGLTTVGQVLHHVQRDRRLVVHVLLDGAEPDLSQVGRLRAAPLAGHTLFIETAEPREVALDVLADVDAGLDDADRLKAEVVEHLQSNAPAAAMERLSGCLTAWNAARESIEKTTQLLRIDVEGIRLDDRTLAESLAAFAGQLRQVRSALEARDYVALADVLAYEMTRTTDEWRQAVAVVRRAVTGSRAA